MTDNSKVKNTLQDVSGRNILARWRFGYEAAHPGVTIMQIGFGRTAKEAEDALKGEATPIITLAIDREQAEELAGDFVAVAKRLQELEEAAQVKAKSN